jgi:DNA-binding HxlR family transcriptional regulator
VKLPHLRTDVVRALTDDWQNTHDLREQIGPSTPMGDVAAVLRQLRRDGLVERTSLGTSGHAWRRVTP